MFYLHTRGQTWRTLRVSESIGGFAKGVVVNEHSVRTNTKMVMNNKAIFVLITVQTITTLILLCFIGVTS